MCRFTVYKGRPLYLETILIHPDNSLIVQSRNADFHPGVDDNTHKRNILVNGDGFGVAWYVDDPSRGSCCCKFITPGWSSTNFRNLGEYVKSSVIVGHVRAASSGHNYIEDVVISTENCHPFKYGRWTFVHNGTFPQFQRVKRAIIMLMSNECFSEIKGSTDSECIFALFLTLLPERDAATDLETFVNCVNRLISTLLEISHNCGVQEACSLNFCITDGIDIIATRYRSNQQQPPSLYYYTGSDFNCVGGRIQSREPHGPAEIIISSEPLSRDCSCYGSDESWVLIPKDHMLIVRGDASDISKIDSITVKPIQATIGEGLISVMSSCCAKVGAIEENKDPGNSLGTGNLFPSGMHYVTFNDIIAASQKSVATAGERSLSGESSVSRHLFSSDGSSYGDGVI